MRFRKFAAMSAAAVVLPALAVIAPASQASAASCKFTSNYIFQMEVCPGTNGGTAIFYYWEYNEPGYFKVWNHDNTSQDAGSDEENPWLYNMETRKMPYWSYTCGQFMAYQGNTRWAPVGPISCIKV